MPMLDTASFETSRAVGLDQGEFEFYSKVLANLNQILKDNCPDTKLDFCPFIYGKCDEDESIIVLENMEQCGFVARKDRFKTLSLEQAKLVIIGLAKFHATSYAYVKNSNNVIEESHSVFEDKYKKLRALIADAG